MRRLKPAEAYMQLDELYASIPDARCTGECLVGCGSVGMTPLEQRRIRDETGLQFEAVSAFALLPVVSPLGSTQQCPALRDGRCTVYEVRPLVCRLWGSSKSLPCPFCGGAGREALSDAASRELQAAVRLLSSRTDP